MLAYGFSARLCTDLWQSQCQSTSSPTIVCPVIVAQWLFVKSRHLEIYISTPFFSLGIIQWTALPETVVWLPTLDAFKDAVGRLHHSHP